MKRIIPGVDQAETDRLATAKPSPTYVLVAEVELMGAIHAAALRQDGYRVTQCTSGIQLIDQTAYFVLPVALSVYDLIISDIGTNFVGGQERLARMHDGEVFPPLILVANCYDNVTPKQTDHLHAAKTICESTDINQFLTIVRSIVVPG